MTTSLPVYHARMSLLLLFSALYFCVSVVSALGANEWICVNSTGFIAAGLPGRYGCAVAAVAGEVMQVMVHGGYGMLNGSHSYFDDLLFLDLTNDNATVLSQNSVMKPSARRFHSAQWVNGNFMICQGRDGREERLGECWRYSLISNVWTQLTNVTNLPALEGTGTSVDKTSRFFLTFGGYCCSNELWRVDVSGVGTAEMVLPAEAGTEPSKRHGTVLVRKGTTDTFLLMGGYDGIVYFEQVFLLELSGLSGLWTELTAAARLSNQTLYGVGMWDPLRNVALFGLGYINGGTNNMYVSDGTGAKWTRLYPNGTALKARGYVGYASVELANGDAALFGIGGFASPASYFSDAFLLQPATIPTMGSTGTTGLTSAIEATSSTHTANPGRASETNVAIIVGAVFAGLCVVSCAVGVIFVTRQQKKQSFEGSVLAGKRNSLPLSSRSAQTPSHNLRLASRRASADLLSPQIEPYQPCDAQRPAHKASHRDSDMDLRSQAQDESDHNKDHESAAGSAAQDEGVANQNKNSDTVVFMAPQDQVVRDASYKTIMSLRPTTNAQKVHSAQAALKLGAAKPLEDVQVLDKIGSGNFGDVFRGLWKGEPVAVKTIVSGKITELEAELDILRRLNHPCIVRYYGLVGLPHDGGSAIVLEYCSGGSLEGMLRAGLIPLEGLPSLALQISRGLEYLAGERILHRDLATRNVLHDASGRCKLTDFGLARAVDNGETYMVTSAIAVRWSAPEVLSERGFTTQSDVYSLAITLWELFSSAAVPFAEISTNSGVTAAVISGVRPPRPPLIPTAIFAIIERCWQANPLDRPTACEVATELTEIVQHLAAAQGVQPAARMDAGSGPATEGKHGSDADYQW